MFRNWVFQNFPFLEDDFDALTDYELFCKMLEYVKIFAKDNEEFKKELNTYENYFENLDVQEEINNKLDEMAESGELNEIIAMYLQMGAVIGFNNISSMKNAENLIDGSICRCLGSNNYSDGKGYYFKIREIENDDVIDEKTLFALTNYNNLLAEKIPENNQELNYRMADFKQFQVKSFAHRGLSATAPENTLASISKAGMYGCYGIEIDAQVTSDGEIVLMHNTTVDDMTDGTGTVNNLTYAYISSLNIDNGNFLTSYETLKIPLLSQALMLCNEYNLVPQIELKGNWTSTDLQKLINIIKEYNMINIAIVISFNYGLMETLRSLNSDIKIILLAGDTLSSYDINTAIGIGKCGISMPYSANNIIPQNDRLTLIENNIPFGFWTLNSISDTKNAIENNPGISFIVSDYAYGQNNIKTKKMIAELTSDGIVSWNSISGTQYVSYMYEDFTITEPTTNNYRLTYAVPFYHPLGGGYTGVPIMKISGINSSKYNIITSGQQLSFFNFNFVRVSDNTIVSATTVYNDIGTVYISIIS